MAKVLVIGSGGREHALAWKLAQSSNVTEVLLAPGNGGTTDGKMRNIPINGTDSSQFDAIAKCIQQEGISLTVVGPEAPLTEGLVDFLASHGIHHVFGPKSYPAQLESDKFFSYQIMDKLGIPQAQGVCCTTRAEAQTAIEQFAPQGGVVLKARGLAAGKGVVVCHDKAEADTALDALQMQFGDDIFVCEKLRGPEFSVFGICDGEHFASLHVAFQDHKARDNGDKGPNTGGMGAYGPTPIAPQERIADVSETVIAPLLRELHEQGHPFRGFLYVGCMLTKEGPKVLEFNVRFGDPECQPAMMLLEDDLYEILQQTCEGTMPSRPLAFRPGAACCVVLASQGYPGAYQKGLAIDGLVDAQSVDGVEVFHAGTKRTKTGDIVTSGGRVLGVTAYSANGLKDAQTAAYKAVSSLSIEGGFHYRTDIAEKAFSS